MTCQEIENLLPAYLDDLLSPEERRSITGHLASCHRCSRVLKGLKKTQKLVRGLEEVEPPPFFEQRIMSRVREEAGWKHRIRQRLFYPLYIKVPIQALAMLLVAVLAIYVSQTGDPEMKPPAPFFQSLTEPGKGRGTVESSHTPAPPSAVTPVTRAPAGDLLKKNQERFVAPPLETGGKEERKAASPAPTREETPAAARPAAPVMAAKEKDILPAGEEALGKTMDRAGRQDAEKVPGPLLPERKRKEKLADAGAAESRKTVSEPSRSRMTAVAPREQSVIELTIQVRDMDAALREIDAHLAQVKARILERQHHEGTAFLKAEIAAPNATALLDKLKALGRFNLETRSLAQPEGNVTVGIKIVRDP